MSDLVGNPEDRFSCVAARMIVKICFTSHFFKLVFNIVFKILLTNFFVDSYIFQEKSLIFLLHRLM